MSNLIPNPTLGVSVSAVQADEQDKRRYDAKVYDPEMTALMECNSTIINENTTKIRSQISQMVGRGKEDKAIRINFNMRSGRIIHFGDRQDSPGHARDFVDHCDLLINNTNSQLPLLRLSECEVSYSPHQHLVIAVNNLIEIYKKEKGS